MTYKRYQITAPKEVMDTAKRLAGDLPLSRYIVDAVKTKNRSIVAKQRSQSQSKPKLDKTTLDYIRAHPEELSPSTPTVTMEMT
jgi:hypothetical protein